MKLAFGGFVTEIEQSPLAVWQQYARDKQLAYQWSPDFERAVYFPRLVCPYGGRMPLEWRVSNGLGVIYSTTLTYPAKGDPYVVALIELDEGFRMMSRVEDSSGDPSEIGRRVLLDFVEEKGSDVPVPIFRLEDEI